MNRPNAASPAPAGSFRERLLRGDRLIGTIISLPSPELAEIASDAGFDWLFVDMEHGTLEAGDVTRLAQAAREPCACLVRVPESQEMWVKKALDTGAAGIIVPHVNSAEEALRAVRWAKYPPEGGRSVGFSRANRYGARFQENVETANSRTVVVVQVEHIDGVGSIEAILDVPGVDAVFVGPYDLSGSLGKPGRIQDDDVREAIGAVASACAARKVPVGIFAADIPASAKALEDGYTLVCSGVDLGFYARSAAAVVKELGSRNP
ncbi:MAG TPA: 2,4-dihydroxyhept-2-ene-1,7-dioic acid aldolase [Candidatus Aminicenantes bacterium]|mgnify:CR=1 FL=1|nr:2,4-dihydroxyhept-2-ene-1,7-dioic acid aldolase [Candidatus Aminicenantes bacterium]HDT13798.1 2,4-dihydroxyhept-2-ene-1,7-dioic acid aldolase [Candidatus Aminicenantes bacterium]